MPPSVHEYLRHILDETVYLLKSSPGLDKAVFLQDETLKRAYVRPALWSTSRAPICQNLSPHRHTIRPEHGRCLWLDHSLE